MEALENIRARRSIRKYTEEKVTPEDIRKIVETAAFAPSWMNVQTAGYIAVLDETLKNDISEHMIAPNDVVNVKQAPAIVILTSKNSLSGFMPDRSEYVPGMSSHWQSFEAGIAAQTFCLAANACGLGTLIMGVWDEAEVSRLAGVQDDCRIAAILAIGHPAEIPTTPKRKSVNDLLTIR